MRRRNHARLTAAATVRRRQAPVMSTAAFRLEGAANVAVLCPYELGAAQARTTTTKVCAGTGCEGIRWPRPCVKERLRVELVFLLKDAGHFELIITERFGMGVKRDSNYRRSGEFQRSPVR